MGVSPAVELTLGEQVASAIRDYGPVVDLNLGHGHLVGSLKRIHDTLLSASRATDPALAALANDALDAVVARERVNGRLWEIEHPKEFAGLTATAKAKLQALYAHVEAQV